MRWLLPLVSLVAAQPVFGELAVYSGALNTQTEPGSGVPPTRKITQIIDLDTGHFITITLGGDRNSFTHLVGPEDAYLISKGKDAQKRAITAFAKVAAGTDETGAATESADQLKGRDAAVNLAGNGPAQWPRTLAGAGWLVATPSRVIATTTALTLNEAWSKLANNAGSLDLATEPVGLAFRNKVAAGLHYPIIASNAGAPGGSTYTGSTAINAGSLMLTNPALTGSMILDTAGLIRTGTGALTLSGSGSSGGTLQISGPPTYGGFTFDTGLHLSGDQAGSLAIYYPPLVDPTLSAGGSFGKSRAGTLLMTGDGNAYSGSVTTSYGNLTLSAGSFDIGGSVSLNVASAGVVRNANALSNLTINSAVTIASADSSILFDPRQITLGPAGSLTFANGTALVINNPDHLADVVHNIVLNPDGHWTITAPDGTLSTGTYTFPAGVIPFTGTATTVAAD